MPELKDFNHAVCDCTIIHQDVVENVKKAMTGFSKAYELSDFFKILGDATRINILMALSHSEMCVCDLSSLLNMTHSAVSHQLRLLKQYRLVRFRKSGKIVYYSLDDQHIGEVLAVGLNHVSEIR
jgi:ArsR family transcriptional regulator, lead/cadmium/zinc/bismuth-responsive transcriptional repressor